MIVLYHYSNPSIIRPAVDFVKQIIKKENTIIQTKNKWISHGRKNFTEEEARAKCAGYKYMSLECPTNKTNFEVWCANDLSGMPVLPDDDCKGKPTVKSLNNGQNGGCNAGGGTFITSEGLNKGGWHRGSVYEI